MPAKTQEIVAKDDEAQQLEQERQTFCDINMVHRKGGRVRHEVPEYLLNRDGTVQFLQSLGGH